MFFAALDGCSLYYRAPLPRTEKIEFALRQNVAFNLTCREAASFYFIFEDMATEKYLCVEFVTDTVHGVITLHNRTVYLQFYFVNK